MDALSRKDAVSSACNYALADMNEGLWRRLSRLPICLYSLRFSMIAYPLSSNKYQPPHCTKEQAKIRLMRPLWILQQGCCLKRFRGFCLKRQASQQKRDSERTMQLTI
eukprot:scaffold3305_cov74-Skeletonema_dohrnii-CCMP3373.AAC.1